MFAFFLFDERTKKYFNEKFKSFELTKFSGEFFASTFVNFSVQQWGGSLEAPDALIVTSGPWLIPPSVPEIVKSQKFLRSRNWGKFQNWFRTDIHERSTQKSNERNNQRESCFGSINKISIDLNLFRHSAKRKFWIQNILFEKENTKRRAKKRE